MHIKIDNVKILRKNQEDICSASSVLKSVSRHKKQKSSGGQPWSLAIETNNKSIYKAQKYKEKKR